MKTYVHKTAQRVRVRSDFIKENPKKIQQLLEQLDQLDAIKQIKHSQYAGSVAISFDAQELSADELLETVASHDWLVSHEKESYVEKAVISGAKTMIKGVMNIALQRLVGQSVSRVIMNIA